jgi:hypothetical protein
MWPKGRHEWLDEAQDGCCQTERRVDRLGAPFAQFHEDNDERGDSHRPGQDHEESVPLEKFEEKFNYRHLFLLREYFAFPIFVLGRLQPNVKQS